MHKHKSFVTFFPTFPLVKVKQPEACSLFLLFPSVSKWLHTDRLGGMKRSLSALHILFFYPILSSAHLVMCMCDCWPLLLKSFSMSSPQWNMFHGHFSTAYLYSALHPGLLMKAWKVDKGFPNQICHASCLTSLQFCLTSASNKLKKPACCMVEKSEVFQYKPVKSMLLTSKHLILEIPIFLHNQYTVLMSKRWNGTKWVKHVHES